MTTFAWMNPHVALRVDVADEGTRMSTIWTIEMGSPSSLARLGWSKRTLKAGDTVIVEGIPASDGSPVGYARVIVLAATGTRLLTSMYNALGSLTSKEEP